MRREPKQSFAHGRPGRSLMIAGGTAVAAYVAAVLAVLWRAAP